MAGAVTPWLPLLGERVQIVRESGRQAAIIRRLDNERVGQLETEAEGDELVVHALCVDEPHRSYGCGSETGWLLVRGAAEGGFHTIRAHAPADRGLAVYFWIRMGLRPLHGEGPGGGLWFERELR